MKKYFKKNESDKQTAKAENTGPAYLGQEIDLARVPNHIAIIMDGNGRWAKKRGMPRYMGHSVGAQTFRKIATYCKDIGVKNLTVYAFSTENWKRPQEEVDTIMRIFGEYLDEARIELTKNNIRINFLGDTSIFTGELAEKIRDVKKINSGRDVLTVNLAVNYDGRSELVMAANRAFEQKGAPITEEDIENNLYTAGQPSPDLIIRTSGEYRLSGFLLWQCSYSELWFADVLWPDFDERAMNEAIAAFQARDRRFGGVESGKDKRAL